MLDGMGAAFGNNRTVAPGDFMDTDTDAAQSRASSLKPGDLLDRRLSIVEEIGRGGMSVVYKAKDLTLDRIVAVKILTGMSDPVLMKRFKTEVQAYALLDHPNIVRVLSSGISEAGVPFLVMEFLSGMTLEERFTNKLKFTMSEFADLFIPIMAALKESHAKGIVHRDIKPGNIMLCTNDEGVQVPKILDFGIAKFITHSAQSLSQSMSAALTGSPLYMSPEQVEGKAVDARSDIYSLACVMYQALTTKPPFAGETPLETMYEHLRKSVPKLEEISTSITISKELVNALIKALAKDAARRQPTMAEFEAEISSALHSGNLNRRTPRAIAIPWVVLVVLACVPAILLLSPWPKKHASQDWRPHESKRISPSAGLSMEAAYNAGVASEAEHKIPEAIASYERAWRMRTPDSNATCCIDICKHLSSLYDFQGKPEKGVQIRLAAMEQVNKGGDLYLGIGNSVLTYYTQQGMYAEAEKFAAKIDEETPADLKGGIGYGEVLMTKGKLYLHERKNALALSVLKSTKVISDLQSRVFVDEFAVKNTWLLYQAYLANGKPAEALEVVNQLKKKMFAQKGYYNQLGSGISGLVYNQKSIAPSFIAYAEEAINANKLEDVPLFLQMSAERARGIPKEKRADIMARVLSAAELYSKACGMCQVERSKLKDELLAERKGKNLGPSKPNSPNLETITRLLHPLAED